MREPRLCRRRGADLDASWLAWEITSPDLPAACTDEALELVDSPTDTSPDPACQTTEAPMQESTSKRATLSAAGKLNVTGMVAAAAGITIQIASGSDLYPTIPPGPIILLAGAALVVLGPWRWTPLVGVVVPLFLLVGATIAAVVSGEFVDQLTDPGEAGIFAGDVLQLVGVITALVAGMVALRQSSRTRTGDRHEQRG
jgi:hypothetical protein